MRYKLYFCKEPFGSSVRLEDVRSARTHRLVTSVDASSKDEAAFAVFSAVRLGISRRAMLPGDVLKDEHGEYWEYLGEGWCKLEAENGK